MSQSDEKIAHEILESLCQSSIVDELEYYKEYIQKDLNLSDEVMNKLYNLTVIASLLMPKITPVKIYKGVQVYPKGTDTKSYKGVQVYPKVVCDGNVCKLVQEEEPKQSAPHVESQTKQPEYKDDLEKYVNEDDFAPQNKTNDYEPEKEELETQDKMTGKKEEQSEEETSDSSESETETQESDDVEKGKTKSVENEVSPVRALKKILKKNEVDYGSVSFDSETNPNTLIVKGVSKVHEDLMRKCTGQWKGGKKHWVFGNEKLLQYYKKTYNEDD